jgi:PAS domain S-box-containing protein
VVVTFVPCPFRKVAEDAVRRSEERFRNLLESAPDAMLVADATGRIELANEGMSRLFGYAREELIGRTIESLMPERFRALHVAKRHSAR